MRTWLSGFGDAPFDYESETSRWPSAANVAHAHGLACMGLPGVFEMWFRLTVGLRKAGGTWRIAHVCNSTLFSMDETRQAAADLQP